MPVMRAKLLADAAVHRVVTELAAAADGYGQPGDLQ